MKKFISLVLALVLCMGLLAGISLAAEKPTECAPDQAGVIVTCAGKDTQYYFETLTMAIIDWAAVELPGDTYFTLTKNIELEPNDGIHFDMPKANDDFYNSEPNAKTLVFDLGGFTLRYAGDSTLFRIRRFGMTVKNGTIDYEGASSAIQIGDPNGITAIKSGATVYAPAVTLENVHIYNHGTANTSFPLENNIFGSVITVKNSLLWSASTSAIELGKTDQTVRDKGYKVSTLPYNVTLNIENSVIGSGTSYAVNLNETVDLTVDSAAISVKDSTLVSNASADAAVESRDAAAFNFNGQEPVVKAGWSQFLNNGKTATGKAYTYGTVVGNDVKLPFTDVNESEWYYTYVRDLYNAKVIAGMTETTFVPNGTLTYGQALKLITLAVGIAEQDPTDTHWASGYLNNALGMGWLYEEVNLDGTITREAFCQIAATAAGIVEQPASNPFKDTQDASVLALYNAGIINGMSADTFSPNSSLTRAQISKIIYGIISR